MQKSAFLNQPTYTVRNQIIRHDIDRPQDDILLENVYCEGKIRGKSVILIKKSSALNITAEKLVELNDSVSRENITAEEVRLNQYGAVMGDVICKSIKMKDGSFIRGTLQYENEYEVDKTSHFFQIKKAIKSVLI